MIKLTLQSLADRSHTLFGSSAGLVFDACHYILALFLSLDFTLHQSFGFTFSFQSYFISWQLHVCSTMTCFLSLPTEIRYEIYRHLRTDRSLSLSPSVENTVTLGYVSYGFHPQILAVNRQMSHEAMHVFYGENHWTFFVSLDIHFKWEYFRLAPLSTALPFMRRVQIRFRMFNELFLTSVLGYVSQEVCIVELRAKVDQIDKILAKARSLQTIRPIWTETSAIWRPQGMYDDWEWTSESGQLVRVIQGIVENILQPLNTLKPSCTVQSSESIVKFGSQVRCTAMEKAFSNAVDALISGRSPSA